MKRAYNFILAAVVILCANSPAHGFMIKGTEKTVEAPAYKIKGAEYLPLTLVCDAYGISPQWDPVSKIVELKKGPTKARFRVGEYRIYANGVISVEEKPVIFHKGAVCIPKDFLKTVFTKFILPTAPLLSLDKARPELSKAAAPISYHKINRIILDAGHGGYDPGAIGRDGIKEKYITLDIVNKIKNILEENGINVTLTRRDDTFIPLWRRADIANRADADLFVSIHANASRTRRLKGFEVYYLSEAIDDNARARAASEDGKINLEKDSIYGHTKELDAVLWDLKLTEDRRSSIGLGNCILDEIDSHKRAIKSARFYVLKGSRMPSVLVEVGYITNKDECIKLGWREYRAEVAKRIAKGILEFKKRFESSGGFTE